MDPSTILLAELVGLVKEELADADAKLSQALAIPDDPASIYKLTVKLETLTRVLKALLRELLEINPPLLARFNEKVFELELEEILRFSRISGRVNP